MSDRATALDDDAHSEAAEAFVERALARNGDEIEELSVFGSTIRGEARGLSSDVDVLLVLDDATERETADLFQI